MSSFESVSNICGFRILNIGENVSILSQGGGQVGTSSRTSQLVKKHKWDGVRRLCAHPHLPLYISGGQDGAVMLWEWSHTHQVPQQVSQFRVRHLLLHDISGSVR